MDAEAFIRDHKARSDGLRKQSFSHWLESPLVKVLLSMIPPGEHPDVLRKVLEACFEAGWEGGTGFTTGEMLKAVLTRPDRR